MMIIVKIIVVIMIIIIIIIIPGVNKGVLVTSFRVWFFLVNIW